MAARGTITVHYGLTGVLNALWGATLPATDARLDLGAGLLGGLLMALAAGALAAMPVAGWLADRWGGRRVLKAAAPAASFALTGPALAASVDSLMIAAAVLGMSMGVLNVALSVQAVAVERALARPIMATMHGTWTLGAVAGGAVVTTALRVGTDARLLMAAGALTLALAMLAAGGKLDEPTPPNPDVRAESCTVQRSAPLRPGLVIALGVVGAAAFITEGAATDWAGVHATRTLGGDPATGSLVYTVFFAAMTLVRFVADAVRARLGAVRTIRLAGGAATAGYGLVLLAGALPAAASTRVACAIAGWALAGAGMAVVWPIVTSLLGAADGSAQRLSMVTTISYGGGLIGPALIGYVATAVTLPLALMIPAVLALVVAAAAPLLFAAVIRTHTTTSHARRGADAPVPRHD
ncbi:MFS transporter [Nonomuraea sp. NBC_00507]|uniref:MFS transporter n=1 Tax=Nonomuraea sp. NBC_00507 TaxID=2976002 RepID=UPI002E18B993